LRRRVPTKKSERISNEQHEIGSSILRGRTINDDDDNDDGDTNNCFCLDQYITISKGLNRFCQGENPKPGRVCLLFCLSGIWVIL